MLAFLSIALVVLAWLWPKIWYRVVRHQISIKLYLSHRHAAAGTSVGLECEFVNHAWLPCPSVEVTINLPVGLSAHPDRTEAKLRLHTYLLPRQSVRLKTTFYAKSRGFKPFFRQPVVVKMHEGLGLMAFYQSVEVQTEMVVLPTFVEGILETPEAKAITGSLERFRWLHPDESLFRGVRAYEFGDAPKHIAWRASAATGQWMVKQYSSSTEPTVYLVLNAQFFEPYWNGTVSEEFEALCSIAATYAAWLEHRGFRITFVTNAVIPRDPLRQFHGRQSAMGIRLLLGRAEPYANCDFGELWKRFYSRRDHTSSVVLFTSFLSPNHSALLLQTVGSEVFLVPGPNPNFSSQYPREAASRGNA